MKEREMLLSYDRTLLRRQGLQLQIVRGTLSM
jgi:hypothetical protein